VVLAKRLDRIGTFESRLFGGGGDAGDGGRNFQSKPRKGGRMKFKRGNMYPVKWGT